MFQCVLVGPVFLGGELAGALVELRGHRAGFFGGTAKRNQNLCELGNFHAKIKSKKPALTKPLPAKRKI